MNNHACSLYVFTLGSEVNKKPRTESQTHPWDDDFERRVERAETFKER